MRRLSFLSTLILIAMAATPIARAQTKIEKTAEGYRVTVSHASTPDGTLPAVFLNQGDVLRIWITDTNLQCFLFNAAVVQPSQTILGFDGGPPQNTAELVITHDEDVTGYTVTVSKRNQTGCETPMTGSIVLGDRSWTIPVKGRWNLAVSGAYSGDNLTNRGFFLEPGTLKVTGAADKQGNYVREDTAAQDRVQWSPSLMAHVYHPGWMWVPFTFGVTSQTTDMKVYLGTGLRFLNKLYITAGYVNGSRRRLPAGVHVGDFTDQANLLNDLPKKNTGGVFLGVSLSFFDHSLSSFQNLVKAPQPAPQPPATQPPTQPAQPQQAQPQTAQPRPPQPPPHL